MDWLTDPRYRSLRISIFLALIYFTQATAGTGGIAGTAIQYYMKEGLGLTATTLAYISSIAGIAWFIKPAFGLLSDFVPLFGYRRKSYILLCNGLAMLVWLVLAWMMYYGMVTTYYPIMIVGVLMGIFLSVTDVATDGYMVQSGNETDETGKFQSIQWTSIKLGAVLVTLSGTYLALQIMPDTGNSTFEITEQIQQRMGYLFAFAALFPVTNIIAAYFLIDEEKIKLTKEKFQEIKAGIWAAVKMKPIWILALCILGLHFSPGWGTPFFYYIRDFAGEGGTQLDKMSLAYLSTLETGLGIIGCLAYWKLCKSIDLKKTLYVSVILTAFASLTYLWASDITSLIILAVLFGPISAFIALAFLDLAARNCPPLAEGFVFAGLMSCINIGNSMSSAVGGYLYEKLNSGGVWYTSTWEYVSWLSSFGVSDNMVGLRMLIILSAAITLVTIFLIPLLRLDSKGKMGL